MIRLLAWPLLIVALLSWGGYWYATTMLSDARAAYASKLEESEQQKTREQSLTRVQSVIRDTEAERAAIERLISVSVVQAVDIVEAAGEAAGGKSVEIVSASPATAPKELSGLSIVVTMEGTFPALMRAVSLFESLPIPSVVETVDIEKSEGMWRLTARLKLFLAANAT